MRLDWSPVFDLQQYLLNYKFKVEARRQFSWTKWSLWFGTDRLGFILPNLDSYSEDIYIWACCLQSLAVSGEKQTLHRQNPLYLKADIWSRWGSCLIPSVCCGWTSVADPQGVRWEESLLRYIPNWHICFTTLLYKIPRSLSRICSIEVIQSGSAEIAFRKCLQETESPTAAFSWELQCLCLAQWEASSSHTYSVADLGVPAPVCRGRETQSSTGSPSPLYRKCFDPIEKHKCMDLISLHGFFPQTTPCFTSQSLSIICCRQVFLLNSHWLYEGQMKLWHGWGGNIVVNQEYLFCTEQCWYFSQHPARKSIPGLCCILC